MFKTRCISAVFLALIALVTLTLGGPVLLATLFFISCAGFYELSKACKVHTDKKVNALEIVSYASIAVLYLKTCFYGVTELTVFWLVGTIMLLLLVYVLTFPKFHSSQVMASFFMILYAPFMFSFIYHIREGKYGIYLVWMVFISSWISDTCAYLVGRTIGKHKLAPILSPKKSIEGSIGGIVGSACVGALYGFLISKKLNQEIRLCWICAILGGIGSVISQLGDLAASAIKRQNDIKDYGTLIPGHGGIMDRFDSVIVTAPLTYFLIQFLLEF